MDIEDEQIFVVYKHEDLFSESFPLMKEIWRMGKLCDVTLKVEDQIFSAHRIVLAATIPYFYAMFTNDMAESRIKEITMEGIEPTALESLINFAYSGQVYIDNQNAQSLMMAASFLQLLKVRNACAEFLMSRFHPHNVLGIRRLADSMSCTDLIRAADMYIEYHFTKVSQSDEFLSLDFEELIEMIKSDFLNVQSEEVIFEACMKWVKHIEDERSSKFPQVLSQVRLPLLSPQFLANRVAREEIIRSSPQCRDLLDEAKDFHLMPESRHLLLSFRSRQRGAFISGQIYVVGGWFEGESVSGVEIYDPLTQKWRMGEPMSKARYHMGVAIMDGKLYAFGGKNGFESLSTVEVYDPKKNLWSQGTAMNYKRSAAGVAALNDCIYVCGGYDDGTYLNTVECYCPNTDMWKTAAPMMKSRSAGGVAVLGSFVYAVGGQDGHSIWDSVERYDPINDAWHKMKPMLNRRRELSVAALNGKLYACGGYDGNSFLRSVEVYDPIKDAWSLVAPMKCKRNRFALVANMGKLWAIGGYDAEIILSTVEVYDPETDVWTFAPSMWALRGGVAAGVIRNQ